MAARRDKRRPGLIRGFAIGGLAAFLAAGIGVSALMARHVRQRALAVATFHAQFVTESVFSSLFTPADLAGPVTGARYEQLRAFFLDRILSDGRDVRVKIWRSDGTVLFSDYEPIVGRVFPEERGELQEVFRGEVLSGVSDLSAQENVGERGLADKLFQTYVPLRLEPGGPVVAAAEIYQDYSVIEADIRGLFRTLALTFGAGLLALYVALLPIALKASRSLRAQNAQLRAQTERLIEQSEELRESFDMLRATNAQRRELLSRLVVAREEEQQRIAADVHDGPVQKLTALGLRLGLLRRRLHDPEDLEALDEIGRTTKVATKELRQLLFDLDPPSLEAEGLGAALRVLLHELAEEADLSTRLEDHLADEPAEPTRTTCFRIAQEALRNVRKHAGASAVEVLLEEAEGGVHVKIRDDGRGFDVNGSAPPGHFGLVGMRERAELVGGRLRLLSDPGRGTTVEFWLPYGGLRADVTPSTAGIQESVPRRPGVPASEEAASI